jgi:GTP cyclohydrolase I
LIGFRSRLFYHMTREGRLSPQGMSKDLIMDVVVGKNAGLPDDIDIRPSREEAEAAVRTLIAFAGDDPSRQGLIDTPRRVINTYRELYQGYDQDVASQLARTFDDVGGYEDPITVRNIPFYSHCEHHMIPFQGVAHISYIPNGRVVGLSKIARVVDIFARRLQTQENMTAQIARALDEGLDCHGIAVLLEGDHQCMIARGIQKSGVSTLTSRFTGVFADNSQAQAQFMMGVKR